MKKTIQIVIVDDHILVANAIAGMIEEHSQEYSVIFKAHSGEQLLEYLQYAKEKPQIILLDINMPGLGGYKTMEMIKQLYPDIFVLALSMNQDETSIIRILKSGACGYVSKFSSETELMVALEKVVKHGEYYGEEVSRILHNQLKKSSKPGSVVLTDREKEVLTLMATELTYKEIGDKLKLSPKTIDGHRESLFQKLHVKSRTGLAVYAFKNGYID